MTKENQQPNFEPAETFGVNNLETLKILSDALRSRLLDHLRAEAQTVKQLAAILNTSPKKLYYHINLMEKHGLIRVVHTRIVSGILEKTYRATAYLFLFEKDVFASTGSEAGALSPGIALLFDLTKNQLEQSLEDKTVDLSEEAPIEHRLLHDWMLFRMTPEKATCFYARLRALMDEFDTPELNLANEQGTAYRFFYSLFPVRHLSGTPMQPTPEETHQHGE